MLLSEKTRMVECIAIQLAYDATRERYEKETSENWDKDHFPKNRRTLIKEYGEVLGGEIEKAAYDLLRKEDDIYRSSAIYKLALQADKQLSTSVPPTVGSYVWGYYPSSPNAAYCPILAYIEMAKTFEDSLSVRRHLRSLCVVDDVAILPPEEFTLDPSEPETILCNYGFMGYTESVVREAFVTPRACDVEHVLAVVCTDGRWYLIRDITGEGDVFTMLPYRFGEMYRKEIEDFRRKRAEEEQQD